MFDQSIQRGITICTVVPLLVTGTGHSITTTVTSAHACNGKVQTPLTALTNAVAPVLDYLTGLAFPALNGVASGGGEAAIVVYGLLEGGADEVGSVKCIQGPKMPVDSAGTINLPCQFPKIPDNICPFAYQVLKHYGQGTSVIFGTTDWNASGFTNAIVRCMQLPVKPQSS